MWGVPGLQRSVSKDRVMGSHGSLLYVRSKGWPVWSVLRVTVAQIAEEVNAHSDRKVSEYKVYCSLLHMGLHSYRPVRWCTRAPELYHKTKEEGGLV